MLEVASNNCYNLSVLSVTAARRCYTRHNRTRSILILHVVHSNISPTVQAHLNSYNTRPTSRRDTRNKSRRQDPSIRTSHNTRSKTALHRTARERGPKHAHHRPPADHSSRWQQPNNSSISVVLVRESRRQLTTPRALHNTDRDTTSTHTRRRSARVPPSTQSSRCYLSRPKHTVHPTVRLGRPANRHKNRSSPTHRPTARRN
mmetsp:Transcript_30610/g.77462  ORF Transcript_30610/g.77462 Transcript_30610/m.77462 type:complete len:203 (-) Transcript_30610:385-993(-)